MEMARNKTEISVSQRKYVTDLMKEIGMLGCKPIDTPMDPNVKLGKTKGGIPVEKFTSRTQDLILLSLSAV